MKHQASFDQAFELEIAGYQFPSIEFADYDSNWLMISIHVNHPLGSWSATGPYLLTYEVKELAQWLEHIVMGIETSADLEFIEPNLHFLLLEEGENRSLRIYFEVEARPKWAPSKYAGEEDLWVDIPVQVDEMFRASQSLMDMLKKFPQRARR